jgi:hypothetical protein
VKSRRKTAVLGTAAATLAAGIAGAGVASAAGGGDASETPITGPAFQRASRVALEHTGQGTVTGTEVDDEEGPYEVEVTLDNGTETDVHLDKDFNVLSSEAESIDESESGG